MWRLLGDLFGKRVKFALGRSWIIVFFMMCLPLGLPLPEDLASHGPVPAHPERVGHTEPLGSAVRARLTALGFQIVREASSG